MLHTYIIVMELITFSTCIHFLGLEENETASCLLACHMVKECMPE